MTKHPYFALPGRKVLLKSDIKIEMVMIDATEPPIELPKKDGSFEFTSTEKLKDVINLMLKATS